MERKRTLTFGLLAIAVVVALALVGVAYALWSETLTINGEVTTGNVSISIGAVSDNDNGWDPGYTKDVGDCWVTGDSNEPAQATIHVSNGYPSYSCTATITVKNDGTVPVNLHDIHFTANPPAWLTVTLPSFTDVQVDPNQTYDISITLHVEQTADENASGSFTAQTLAHQWNEEP